MLDIIVVVKKFVLSLKAVFWLFIIFVHCYKSMLASSDCQSSYSEQLPGLHKAAKVTSCQGTTEQLKWPAAQSTTRQLKWPAARVPQAAKVASCQGTTEQLKSPATRAPRAAKVTSLAAWQLHNAAKVTSCQGTNKQLQWPTARAPQNH